MIVIFNINNNRIKRIKSNKFIFVLHKSTAQILKIFCISHSLFLPLNNLTLDYILSISLIYLFSAKSLQAKVEVCKLGWFWDNK